jgi:hypothetical protein
MTRIMTSSKPSQRSGARRPPGNGGARERSDERSAGQLIERIVVEYARAWRGPRPHAKRHNARVRLALSD